VEVLKSEAFATVVAVVHKTKIALFLQTYEKVIPWNETKGIFAAIPRTAKSLDIEDKDGNQLWRFIVLRDMLEEYLVEGKKAGLFLKKFNYNREQY